MARAVTAEVARSIVDLSYDELPPPCLRAAREAVLDQLGIMLMGSSLPWTQHVYEVVKSTAGASVCTVVGKGYRFSAPDAAYVNAGFGHSCELDDSGYEAAAHPGALTVPPALAIAERHRLTGRALLLAVVAGYDTLSMIGRIAGRAILNRGFHHQGVLGPFGAAAVAGKLLQLDHSKMVNALSIAGSHSAGTMEYDQQGGEVKRIHSSIPVRGGVMAALLAARGLTGPATILEGRRGVARLFAGLEDIDAIADPLGPSGWHAVEGRIVKRFPALGTLHTSIQAVDRILRAHAVNTDEISRIDVYVNSLTLDHGGGIDRPTDVIGAQFSMAFSLALRILRGRNELADYMDPQLWRDPAVVRVVDKVQLHADASMVGAAWFGARVAITLVDGRCFEATELYRKGSPQNPLSSRDLEDKFLELATAVVPEARARKIIDAVAHLDEVDDITQLTNLLAGPAC